MATVHPVTAGEELRPTDHTIYGASTVTINNTIYIYGGYSDLTQLISPNDQSLMTFGGHLPVNVTSTLPPEPLRYYKYSFANNTWTPLQKTIGAPMERFWHSATLTPDKTTVYLYGGMNITGPLYDDFWQYDIERDEWTDLTTYQSTPRCGHTASMLRSVQGNKHFKLVDRDRMDAKYGYTVAELKKG
ncbi:hypothetical protein EC973_002278 [Apophysomyces ossiformis]|uniref:Attractin/MKLN-like beta-propeller domain-containing protein n=1 Tax=Apophysomyces ossiformis TaxID=679940 RepID=A0A8H7BP16_9FUNG|nr:hypothetical protein EC973_002278 [Apophysomyces ossiformis]